MMDRDDFLRGLYHDLWELRFDSQTPISGDEILPDKYWIIDQEERDALTTVIDMILDMRVMAGISRRMMDALDVSPKKSTKNVKK